MGGYEGAGGGTATEGYEGAGVGRSTAVGVGGSCVTGGGVSGYCDGPLEQDVRWLDVTLDHSLAVRVVERVGDGPQDADAVVELNRSAHARGQRPAIDVLADDVGDTVLLAVVEDRKDVGMLQAGDRHRLAVEPRLETRLLDQELGQNLERDLALERGLIGAVDGRHPTFTQLPEDLVWPDLCPWLELHHQMRWGRSGQRGGITPR